LKNADFKKESPIAFLGSKTEYRQKKLLRQVRDKHNIPRYGILSNTHMEVYGKLTMEKMTFLFCQMHLGLFTLSNYIAKTIINIIAVISLT
jgi:hypothetical protein